METITKETESINVTNLDIDAQIQKAEHYLDEHREGMSIEWINGFQYGLGTISGKIEVE